MVKQKLTGTIAVLTHTNEESLLVQQALWQQHVPARLILKEVGFSLRQLLKLKCFSHYLHTSIKKEVGFISEVDWQACKERVKCEIASSINLNLVLQVIEVYEKGSSPRRYWSEWQAYLQEVKAEDFFFPETSKVLVSTMHKAIGKEFDHVFLLLKEYKLTSEDRKRVVYVAITRARLSMRIHTDQFFFNQLRGPSLPLRMMLLSTRSPKPFSWNQA
ncbi:ATP-binding domain-containing protein [Adhaeribacter radiodurans]|uniref:DNA 3'-5' helicase II n=1 Tax=Adhaeribacter radiodurans TaxID=2745197 RepID=A0A7L7L5T4_9BACT|nr:ATP-binding domain-containing protein [Adhaeribacter radiodurans]